MLLPLLLMLLQLVASVGWLAELVKLATTTSVSVCSFGCDVDRTQTHKCCCSHSHTALAKLVEQQQQQTTSQ